MNEPHATAKDARLMRVFLSSTFVDFQEERELLVKRVFPSLRRRAASRGVEIVDVDLRWGVTEEMTQQGQTLPLCLAEIDRCRPYFIGLLGERHGWVPPAEFYRPELLQQQPWLSEHQGGASVTELEILHGVLRNPEMAGYARFYLRERAYALAQQDPAWLAQGEKEHQRLENLKQRVRASDFPVVEGLANPEAIASRIEADLWELIEKRFPEQEESTPLEKEARKHADYRRSRTGDGQYIGGETYIQQLEQWIEAGEQRILITGESGVGKSALIANWIEAHQQNHPKDVVYSHHLGCTNDANALRPLLGRLIDTASKQLLEAEVISEALAVPNDWWELVAKVAETLQDLSRWCRTSGGRWIWVLDGLDRLDPDDQNALPWLPQNLPDRVHVVATALACPARTILSERGYSTLTIAPLAAAEQEQLIQRYLQRYTKQLDDGLRQQILDHPLAGSPLFLKVLLEELRQCGQFDTLKSQLDFYLSSKTIDDVYERVLERLENDGSGDDVRKVMTAIWASRAGLSETELLEITDVKRLQWIPIDLALEKAFGRNGNRLVFEHDFLRIAVKDRYLPSEEQQRQAHSELADWWGLKKEWDERKAEEWPWQLLEAERKGDLRTLFLDVSQLFELAKKRDKRETINYWIAARGEGDGELDELIANDLDTEIEKRREDPEGLIWFVDEIAGLFDEAGLYREPLLKLRALSLELEEASVDRSEKTKLTSLRSLAKTYRDLGRHDSSLSLYRRYYEGLERLQGKEHPSAFTAMNDLGLICLEKGDPDSARSHLEQALEAAERSLGPGDIKLAPILNNLGLVHQDKGEYEMAFYFLERSLEVSRQQKGPEARATLCTKLNLASLYRENDCHSEAMSRCKEILSQIEHLLGVEHPDICAGLNLLALLYSDMGAFDEAMKALKRALNTCLRIVGKDHPDTLDTLDNLAELSLDMGDYEGAEVCYTQILEARKRLLGAEDPKTLSTIFCLANLLSDLARHDEAIPLRRLELEVVGKRDGRNAPGTLTSIHRLAHDMTWNGQLQESEQLYREALTGRITVLGDDDAATMACRYGLARCLSEQKRFDEAIELRRIELAWCQSNHDVDAMDMLTSMHGLGCDLLAVGETEEALEVLQSCLLQRQSLLGHTDADTLTTLAKVLEALSIQGRQRDAIALSQHAYQAIVEEQGESHPEALTQLSNQASLHEELEELEQAEGLYKCCLKGREQTLGVDHVDTLSTAYNLADLLSQQQRHAEAIPLRQRELAWCRQQDGDRDPGTLASINGLAIDLRETAALEEAEALFRELVASRQEVLEPEDFQIGRALGGLAKTMEEAGKLEEALTYSQQALDHRMAHEGRDAWWTNRERVDLARVLHKLGKNSDALDELNEFKASMARIDKSDDDDRQMIREAENLKRLIEEML